MRILKSLFPPLILELYKLLIAPLAQGNIAALMVGEFCLNLQSSVSMKYYQCTEIRKTQKILGGFYRDDI